MFNFTPSWCNEYKLEDRISYTNNSVVYEATNYKNKEKVILKFIQILENNSEQAQNECDMQSLAHHPFIISAKHWLFKARNNRYIVLEMPLAKCSLACVHKYIDNDQTIYKIMF